MFPDPRCSPNLDISKIGARIIDELVLAMKDVNIDDSELSCIKALVFFDPSELKIDSNHIFFFCNDLFFFIEQKVLMLRVNGPLNSTFI